MAMDEPARPRTRVDFEHGYAEFDPTDQERMGGRLVPRLITVHIAGAPDHPATTLTLEARSGVPVCTQVTVQAKPEGREVRVADLRAIRLEDWLEAIIAEVALRIVITDDAGDPVVVSPAPGTPEARRVAVAAVRAARSGTRRRITDAHLRGVATVYLADTTGAPNKAVVERFGVPKRTAARWVAAARDKGFIPGRDEK
jgi:hypothetical protein